MLAKRHGINQKTVAKWKKRTAVKDLPTEPKDPHSTVLTIEDEAVLVAFRRHTLSPPACPTEVARFVCAGSRRRTSRLPLVDHAAARSGRWKYTYWKGRKPLILNRACILGALLPATDDPEEDLAIFESLMIIDDEGFVQRARGSTCCAR